MKKIALSLLAGTVLLAGCSHTQKVATTKPTDSQLSCKQINAEFTQLNTVLAEARKNKGVSGANVAAAIFFWPAVVGNYVDAEDAEKLVKERQNNLTALSIKKGC